MHRTEKHTYFIAVVRGVAVAAATGKTGKQTAGRTLWSSSVTEEYDHARQRSLPVKKPISRALEQG
jgi:hypothetical protein